MRPDRGREDRRSRLQRSGSGRSPLRNPALRDLGVNDDGSEQTAQTTSDLPCKRLKFGARAPLPCRDCRLVAGPGAEG
jgi:hypothetical protein